jgi:hypothetical protein
MHQQRRVFEKWRCPILDSCHRLQKLLKDQTESNSRGMLQRIWKTERKEVLWALAAKQRKTLRSETQVSKKMYRLNKWNKKCPSLSKRVPYSYIVITGMCEYDEAKYINHILWQCNLFEEFWVHMIDDLMKSNIFPPYFIEAIVHCILPEAVIPVVRCINNINIRI